MPEINVDLLRAAAPAVAAHALLLRARTIHIIDATTPITSRPIHIGAKHRSLTSARLPASTPPTARIGTAQHTTQATAASPIAGDPTS